MNRSQQLSAWNSTQEVLLQLTSGEKGSPWHEEYENVIHLADINNPWFTRKQVENAFQGAIKLLDPVKLASWVEKYPLIESPVKVGVIMAGNIPMAGFHDFLSVLLSGNQLNAKLSTSDRYLIPFVAKILFSFAPVLKDKFVIADQLKDVEAVIATGSNNTSRYFEYYFSKIPHIFRKNRNSAAVLTGKENEFDLLLYGRDIFTYFGLGCRNVSKFYVPENYNFDELFNSFLQYDDVMQHSKYMNNFDYNQAVYLMNRQPFLTNNFVIIIENDSLASPVSVLHFEYYKNDVELQQKLNSVKDELQCVVSKSGSVLPGQTQNPAITDYADNVDTMAFLTSLKK